MLRLSMSKNLKNIIKYLLPAIFISYMVGISFFMHTHIINGVTIVHSHPFDNDLEHSHNKSEFELINGFNTTSFIDNIIAEVLQNPFLNLIAIFSEAMNSDHYHVEELQCISLRAPPPA